MERNDALVAAKLRRWEAYLAAYRLPAWEEIPNFGLYMEQVIALLTEYLDYLPPELKEEEFITAAAINNYVRIKLMPKPQKKKYDRLHIAYLILICTLKQGLSLSLIQKLIPADSEEEIVREIYRTYVDRHCGAAQYFIEQVRVAAGPILGHGGAPGPTAHSADELVALSAIIGGFSRLLAEKLALLEDKEAADEAEAPANETKKPPRR